MQIKKMDEDNLLEILDLVQCSSACHLKYANILKKAIEKDDDLFKRLCDGIELAFLTNYTEKNPYVSRVVDFIALFATTFDKPTQNGDTGENLQLHPILHKILKFMLELSQSASEAHRYWSCFLLNKIFQNQNELQEEVCEEIQEFMLERLKDSKAVIRCQAIMALYRFQDPSNAEDLIISEICFLLSSDFNAKVRQLCLEKLALNKSALQPVLDRIRDVDSNVRLSAFKRLPPIAKYLKVSQKRWVLQCGFCDEFEKIRLFTSTELLNAWLHTYNNDYVKLMKSIRLDACHADIQLTVYLAELVLQALFKGTPIDDIIKCVNLSNKFIKYEDLNWESVLYYRICVQYLRKSNAYEENLDTILPELLPFCDYVENYCRFAKGNGNLYELEQQFILQQLFSITKGYDVDDAAKRQRLTSLVYHMLTTQNLSTHTAEIVISNLEKTIASVNDRSIFVCEIISNILHGENIDYKEIERQEVERNQAISQLQSDVSSLTDEENHLALVEKKFEEAERVKQEILQKQELLKELRTVREKPEQNELKTDAATLSKVLNIATGLLLSPTIKKFNPAISRLHFEVISPALMHQDARVTTKALRCYALCCIIDETTARYGIHIFSGILLNENAEVSVLAISIKVIADLIRIYGLNLIGKRDEEDIRDSSDSTREENGKPVFVGGTSLSDLIRALAFHLDHKDLEVQSVATKGVCILLLCRRITSSSLLSRLIIKWASPATDDLKLKQFIGQTLTELVTFDNCHTYFGDAVITTITTIDKAPNRSPLADIDMDNLIKFMVALCGTSSQAQSIHRELAFKILDIMLANPKRKVNFIFSKTLLLLNLPEDDSRDELSVQCEDLRDIIRDNQILKNIKKFNTNLTKKQEKKLVPIEEAQENAEI